MTLLDTPTSWWTRLTGANRTAPRKGDKTSWKAGTAWDAERLAEVKRALGGA